MRIQFCGAAREVTGSQHLLKVNGKQILLDCGLFQGKRQESNEKNRKFLFQPAEIDAVILSHAHIDHSGNIPALVKQGFRGPIYATHATHDLCTHMLLDSAYIQEKESEYLLRRFAKKRKQPKFPIEPLYTTDDATLALKHFVSFAYDRPFEIVPGVTASFRDAGHILGASIIALVIDDHETKKQIIFVYTGDLGRKNLPILRDPTLIERADVLLIESTYGNRFHADVADIEDRLAVIVKETAQKGGKIIVPAFAVERTQEIVYHMNILYQRKLIPDIPIYVDSPLAVNITEVFTSHPECFDKETWKEFINNQKNPFGFGRLKYITDVEDSKALNESRGPMMIISSAGMCENGRIIHHLKNNIGDSRNTVLAVGYMAKETLGRKLVDGMKVVNIFGEPYDVRAKVVVLDAFSAHADRSDLLDFISKIKGLKKIFLVHGEEEQQDAFKKILTEAGHREVQTPERGQEFTF